MKTPTPAPLLRSVFIVIVFLLIALSSSSDDLCTPFSCNDFLGPEIKFPFRITGKQPERCGYPGFNLSCNDFGETVITLPETPGSFVVNDIDYASQIIQISDPDNCLSRRILNLSLAGSPFRAPDDMRYTILSCPFVVPILVPCQGNMNKSVIAVPGSFYVEVPAACSIVAENVSIPRSVERDDPAEILGEGVVTRLELRWEKPNCRDCGGTPNKVCGFSTDQGLEIGCSDPPIPSKGAMRSFPVSARPPAPAKKISLGAKKAGPARPTDPSAEALGAKALVPAGLPLTATHPSNLSGDHGETRAAKHGNEKEADVEEVAPAKRTRHDGTGSTTPVIDVLMKHGDEPPAALLSRICAAAPPPEKTSWWSTALVGERIACDLIQMAHSVTDLFARAKDGDEIHRREVAPLKKSLAKRDQRIKELEGKLKTAEETGRRILERADLGEKILTDPVLLARHICRGQETGEAVLAAISRTPVGEDLMYEFGTWAFNSGRRAMQNDVKTALEVAMDEADLPNILAVLPEEVPDPGPTPFSSVPEGRNLPVPVVEVSGGPLAEAAATTGPSTELGATQRAGPSAEGDGEPRADPAREAS